MLRCMHAHHVVTLSVRLPPGTPLGRLKADFFVVSQIAGTPFAKVVSPIGSTQLSRTTVKLAPVACHPILVPPAGSPHVHPRLRTFLSSVSLGLQRSLVGSRVHGKRKRQHRHQCHQLVGVGHAGISLLARLTSSSGDRFALF